MTTKQKLQALYNTLDGLTVQGHSNIRIMENVFEFLNTCIQEESEQECAPATPVDD